MHTSSALSTCRARVPAFGSSRPASAVLRTAVSSRCSHRHSQLLTVQLAPASRQIDMQAQLLKPLKAAEDEGSAFDYDEPETAKEGIDLGLVLCKQGKWSQALAVFEKSLSLPGTGVKRFRDKPRLISDGEKMALLYNIACCHSQMQDARSGLVALSGCMETGYTDFNQIRTDPDLEFLRADSRFEGLMERFQKTSGGFLGLDLGSLFGGKK